MTLRVVIADDAVLVRSAIGMVLREHDVHVVAEVGDRTALWDAVVEHTPDLAVVDIRMPPGYGTEGLAAAIQIRAAYPRTSVLLLSQYVESRYLVALFADDPRGVGYLLKERVASVREFVDALNRVAGGDCAIDPLVVQAMMSNRRRDDPLHRLTEREREVLGLIAEGLSNQAIGARLKLTPKTVESHVRSIFLGLDLPPEPGYHRRVLAVLAQLRSTGP